MKPVYAFIIGLFQVNTMQSTRQYKKSYVSLLDLIEQNSLCYAIRRHTRLPPHGFDEHDGYTRPGVS